MIRKSIYVWMSLFTFLSQFTYFFHNYFGPYNFHLLLSWFRNDIRSDIGEWYLFLCIPQYKRSIDTIRNAQRVCVSVTRRIQVVRWRIWGGEVLTRVASRVGKRRLQKFKGWRFIAAFVVETGLCRIGSPESGDQQTSSSNINRHHHQYFHYHSLLLVLKPSYGNSWWQNCPLRSIWGKLTWRHRQPDGVALSVWGRTSVISCMFRNSRTYREPEIWKSRYISTHFSYRRWFRLGWLMNMLDHCPTFGFVDWLDKSALQWWWWNLY